MSTLRMNADYEYVVAGIYITDADFVLEIGYSQDDRSGEVYDYWIEAIGTSHYDLRQKREVLTWLPEAAWTAPLIKEALDYFKSSKFAHRVQEAADEAGAVAA